VKECMVWAVLELMLWLTLLSMLEKIGVRIEND
jgi:hypothetical protein